MTASIDPPALPLADWQRVQTWAIAVGAHAVSLSRVATHITGSGTAWRLTCQASELPGRPGARCYTGDTFDEVLLQAEADAAAEGRPVP